MTYKFDRDQLQAKLEDKGAVLPCHRCGHTSFAIMPGVSRIQLDDSFDPGTFSMVEVSKCLSHMWYVIIVQQLLCMLLVDLD